MPGLFVEAQRAANPVDDALLGVKVSSFLAALVHGRMLAAY